MILCSIDSLLYENPNVCPLALGGGRRSAQWPWQEGHPVSKAGVKGAA